MCLLREERLCWRRLGVMDYSYNRVVEVPEERERLLIAQSALKHGQRDKAYRLSLELTRSFPNNADAWLLRSKTAVSTEESLYALSQVNRINPNHPAAKLYTYQALENMLERDPFLAYMDESDDLYYVRSKNYLSLVVPKDRNIPEKYPPQNPQPLASAYRYLLLAVFGMIFSGLGTLLFAPLAVLAALQARRRGLKQEDLMRSRVIVWVSFLLIAPAILLVLIFALHFRGF
jgi:hypothetical protein